MLSPRRTSIQQHFLAHNVGDLLARGCQVLLRDRVGGGMYRLATVQGNGDKRDIHRR